MLEFHLGEIKGEPLVYRRKENALSLTVGFSEVYTFDLEGRPFSAFFGGKTYRIALDLRVLEVWRERGRRRVRLFEFEEAFPIFEHLLSRVKEIKRELEDPYLEKIRSLNLERLKKLREEFLKVYLPVNILPPDQYLSLYLQLTLGCPWNKCAFCYFYKDRPFRIKSVNEVVSHILKVKSFLGEGIVMRKSIFLGDANALIIPGKILLRVFEKINEEFDIVPLDIAPEELAKYEAEHPNAKRGIYSFIDAFTGIKKDISLYKKLRDMNLRRVYLGLETGSIEVMEVLNKPATPQDALQLVETLKNAGINVGVIVLVGAGGVKIKEKHLKETVSLLSAMDLSRGDIVYLSPLVISEGDPLYRIFQKTGWGVPTERDIYAELMSFKDELSYLLKRGIKVSIYDIKEFIY